MPRLSRPLALATLVVLGVLGAGLLPPGPAAAAARTADPALGVRVVGPVTSYVGDSNLNLVGEVQAGSQPVEGVQVSLAVLDGAGAQVATGDAYTTVGVLAAGSRSPFRARVQPVPAAHSSVRVLSVTASPAVHGPSLITAIHPSSSPDAAAASQGTVTDDLPYSVGVIKVIGTFYDSTGTPVFTSYVDAQDDRFNTGASPGGTLNYTITRGEGAPTFDPARTRLVAESNEPGPLLPTPGATPAAGGSPGAVRHRPVVDSVPLVGAVRTDPDPVGVRPTAIPAAPPARHDPVRVRVAVAADPSPAAYRPLAETRRPAPVDDGSTALWGVVGIFALLGAGALLLRRRGGVGAG